MNRVLRRPRRDGFPARLIQDMAAAAGVAVGHQGARPAATTTAPRRRARAVPRLLPRTVQLCIHCRESPAGFWVSRKNGKVGRAWGFRGRDPPACVHSTCNSARTIEATSG
jgi:hypothetical protein